MKKSSIFLSISILSLISSIGIVTVLPLFVELSILMAGVYCLLFCVLFAMFLELHKDEYYYERSEIRAERERKLRVLIKAKDAAWGKYNANPTEENYTHYKSIKL